MSNMIYIALFSSMLFSLHAEPEPKQEKIPHVKKETKIKAIKFGKATILLFPNAKVKYTTEGKVITVTGKCEVSGLNKTKYTSLKSFTYNKVTGKVSMEQVKVDF